MSGGDSKEALVKHPHPPSYTATADGCPAVGMDAAANKGVDGIPTTGGPVVASPGQPLGARPRTPAVAASDLLPMGAAVGYDPGLAGQPSYRVDYESQHKPERVTHAGILGGTDVNGPWVVPRVIRWDTEEPTNDDMAMLLLFGCSVDTLANANASNSNSPAISTPSWQPEGIMPDLPASTNN